MQCKHFLGDIVRCADLQRSVVVAPTYFAFVYGKDKAAVRKFFTSVADESPLPVMIYNVRAIKS